MNKSKLKRAEKAFFARYPGGFLHPELVSVGKKHKMDQMISLAQQSFTRACFSDPATITTQMATIVSRSSMISMFEKPRFKDALSSSPGGDLSSLSNGLKKYLHGSQKNGFNEQLNFLQTHKLAKWSLITIIPNYYKPMDEVFVKPSTAKGIIEYFELNGLLYKPQPSWEFYQHYREVIFEMRSLVDKSLAPSNAAFCGFLMMSMAA
ncbi:hypothetical protein SAMN02745866_01230 [Alteromonadaceae bacterium Bs31]|nr:hypothetical protein SAMN02745866_01230 [Alteromonadaceae bacterium Bs31]